MTKNSRNVFMALGLAALASLAACGGSSRAPDATPDGGTPVADCFTGTPVANTDFLNACTPDSVTKILKTSGIPRGKSTLPPLP